MPDGYDICYIITLIKSQATRVDVFNTLLKTALVPRL